MVGGCRRIKSTPFLETNGGVHNLRRGENGYRGAIVDTIILGRENIFVNMLVILYIYV